MDTERLVAEQSCNSIFICCQERADMCSLLTLKVLNFWKFTSYCSLKTLVVGHGGSSAGSYLADPTSPIPSHCASIVATSTLRVNSVEIDVMYIICSLNGLCLSLWFVKMEIRQNKTYSSPRGLVFSSNQSNWTDRLDTEERGNLILLVVKYLKN